MTSKVLENEFDPLKSWKLKVKGPKIYLWFSLTNMPFTYKTP